MPGVKESEPKSVWMSAQEIFKIAVWIIGLYFIIFCYICHCFLFLLFEVTFLCLYASNIFLFIFSVATDRFTRSQLKFMEQQQSQDLADKRLEREGWIQKR